MIWTTLVLALRQLARNKVRTSLTSLGILIGVAAVIAMVSIGRGATAAVEQDLSSLGENLLFVVPGSRHGPGGGAGRPFTEGDVTAIGEQVRGVAAVAPLNSRSVVATAGEQTWTTAVTGTSGVYLEVMRWQVDQGRTFEEGELLSGADVCLLGRTVQDELFGAQSPLDQSVRLESLTCRVVGTLQPKGQSTFGQDQDDFVLVPLRAFQRRIQGNRDIATIFVSAVEGADSVQVRQDIEALMRQRRHIREGAEADFTVRDMAELVNMLNSVSGVLTGLLAAVAAVSLLVGGIGIMNIMMVSVTERTREIGIRLAVGALARDVLLQFLVEAMVLAAFGGVAGTIVGVLASWGAAQGLDVPFIVSPAVIGGAVAFSGFIGIVFGFFPARHAARMRPIDALRHE